MKKKMYLLLDTEFCGGSTPLVYDMGMIVIDKKGKVHAKYSFIINEIFYGLPEKFHTHYYREKLPIYLEDLALKKRTLVSFWTARRVFVELLKKWEISAVIGFNIIADVKALNNTAEVLGNGSKLYFFSPNTEFYCLWNMSRQIYTNRYTFVKFCQDNNLFTNNGNPSLSAENIYRYLTHNPNFKENHTGLEDCMIEKEIFCHIMRQKKKIKKGFKRE